MLDVLKMQHLLPALLAGVLLVFAMPTTAQSSQDLIDIDPGSELVTPTPHVTHGEGCCRFSQGSNGQCHAIAALTENTLTGEPAWSLDFTMAAAMKLRAPPLAPPFKPPTSSI